MSSGKDFFDQADNDMLVRMVLDGFRRIIVHYGAWFAEVEHQVGLEKALAVEEDVWQASLPSRTARRASAPVMERCSDLINCSSIPLVPLDGASTSILGGSRRCRPIVI